MFARVSTFQGKAEDIKNSVNFIRTEIPQKMKDVKGYKGFLMLINPSAEKSIGITFWDSEENMKASEQEANKVRKETADKTAEKILSVEPYEIAVQDWVR
jgi:heme-degrading monooxygenase HmoA